MMIIIFRIIFLLLVALIFKISFFAGKENDLLADIYPCLLLTTLSIAFLLIILGSVTTPFWTLLLSLALSFRILFLTYQVFKADSNKRDKNKEELNYSKKIAPESDNNQFDFIFKEEEIFKQIFNEISLAKDHIHLLTFIIRDDTLGRKLKELLIKKAEAGIEVRLIYDGLGSRGFKKAYQQELIEAGVEIAVFNSLFKSISNAKINNRLHSKLLIIDGKTAFSSDINFGKEYIGKNSRESFAFKLSGEIVNYLQKVYLTKWHELKADKLLVNKYFPEIKHKTGVKVKVVNDAYNTSNQIEQSYLDLIKQASDHIYLVSPYLTLSNSLISSFKAVAKKGVKVNFILSQKVNSSVINWANETIFAKLLSSSNINIYMYQKEFLHARALIIDDRMMSFGSAAFNTRSLYLDDETNFVISDQAKTKELLTKAENYKRDSYQIEAKHYLDPPFRVQLKTAIGSLIAPLV